MPRLLLGDVATLIFGQPDADRFFTWADSKAVAYHIEELKAAIPFGQSGAPKGPNMTEILRYCDIDQKTYRYSTHFQEDKESWTDAEHFARAACRIVRENDQESGVLSPKKFPTYEERCIAAIHTIRIIRYEHNPTRRGHYSDNFASTSEAQITETTKLKSAAVPVSTNDIYLVFDLEGGLPTNFKRKTPPKQDVVSDANIRINNMREGAVRALPWMQWQTRKCFEALTMLSMQGKRAEYAVDSVVTLIPDEEARAQALQMERLAIKENDSYKPFDAPTEQEMENLSSARSILDGQANGPTYSEAIDYLKIHNVQKPYLPGSSPTLELKHFQVVGIAWGKQKLMLNGGAILGDQMGLGKTIQALGIIQSIATDEMMLARDDHKASMIVVPSNVLYNWVSEAQRYFPGLEVMAYGAGTDTIRSDHAFLNGCKANLKRVIITSYRVMLRHSYDKAKKWSKENNKEALSWEYSLVNRIGTLVIDEATAIKSTASQLYTTLKSMRAERHLCLTATLCDNTFLDAGGPISLIDTDRLWVNHLNDPRLNPFELPFSDPRTILCGTLKAFQENVEKVFKKDEAQAAINMRKLLKEIFRRVTYDTIFHGPNGAHKVGEDIPPFRKVFTELEFLPEQEKKYIEMVSGIASQLFTMEMSKNDKPYMKFHLDVFRDLHVMSTWPSLHYVKKWHVKVTNKDRKDKLDLKRFLQLMEEESAFKWNGRWKGKSLNDCSDVELFHGIAAESPIIQEIAFLVAHIVLVERRKVIVWTDFPLPQFFLELCLKATGFPVESYHSDLNDRQRIELTDRFNDPKEKPFAMIMSTMLSAYGLNLQHDCSDEIMAGTTFSDPQEGQALGRIHRLGQLRATQAYKLMLKNSFMQVRIVKRIEKVIPDMISHMCSPKDIDEENCDYFVQVKGHSEEELAENLWKQLEGVEDLPSMPEWFIGVLPEKKNKGRRRRR